MLSISSDSPQVSKSILTDFRGGMRRNVDPMQLDTNEYFFMSNGRTRNGSIRPVLRPNEMTGQLPAGKYQTVFGYGNFLILFIAGKAFVRDYSSPNSQFANLTSFIMDPFVDYIYTAAVAASSANLRRQSIDGNPSSDVILTDTVTGTPSCLLCQDGINRPRLIFPNGASRQANDIGSWINGDSLNDQREYVPIGKQMLNSGDILYIVSPNGLELYRSVTGRPLDFVVAIDQNGDKLPPHSSGIEASRLSYKADFNPITCIADLPSVPTNPDEGAGFFLSTGQASYMIVPRYNTTLFNEPTFRKNVLFPTGPFNQFSITDILGDTAIINDAGITSFNAVAQTRNEGKNAPLHDHVYDLFEGITQGFTASYTSNNYGYFAIDTIFGKGILVYDTLRAKWNSFDIYSGVNGYIKQFAEVKIGSTRKMFFITSANQLFEMEAGTTIAPVTIYTRELTALDNSEVEILPKRVRVVFDDISEAGTLQVTEYVDHKKGLMRSKSINKITDIESPPIAPPFGTNPDKDSTTNITIPIELSRKGDKAGLMLSWDFACEVNKIGLIVETDESATSEEDKGSTFKSRRGSL